MPTVPTTFVPQVTPSGGGDIGDFAAPPVQPMQNAAPEQVQQFGRAMTQAGNVAYSAGIAIQDAIDEAETKASDVAFLQQANEIMRGQNGFMNTKGAQAKNAFQATQDALSQAGQQSMDRLQNETQRRMFQNVLSRNMMTFQTQALSHYNTEAVNYDREASRSRAMSYVGLSVESHKNRGKVGSDGLPSDEYVTDLAVAINEIRSVGRLNGFVENSPQMKDLEQIVYSTWTAGVAEQLADDKDYDEALALVDNMRAADKLPADIAKKLRDGLEANQRREMVTELTGSIRWSGSLETPSGSANFAELVKGGRYEQDKDGLQVIGARNSFVSSPTSAIVKSIDGTTVVLSARGDREIVLTNVDPSRLLAVGMEIPRGYILGYVGGENQTDDGLYPVGYSVIRNGERIDPRAVNSLQEDWNESAEKPKTLTEALNIAARINDDQLRRDVQSNLRTVYGQEEQLQRDQYNDNLASVENQLASGVSMADIPKAQWAELKPVHREQLMKAQQIRDDERVLNELYTNPSLLTPEYLSKNEGSLSLQTKQRLRGLLNSPEKLYAVTVDATQVNETMINNGFRHLINPQAADMEAVQQSILLRATIERDINTDQKRLKRELDRDEKQTIIDAALMTYGRTRKTQRFLGFDYLWPDVDETGLLSTMTREQLGGVSAGTEVVRYGNTEISIEKYYEIRDKLENAGGRIPSTREIFSYFMQAKP